MWPPLDEAFLTAYAETQRFTLGLPTVLEVLPNGHVLFRRTGPRDRTAQLFALDPKSGQVTTLADPAALLAGNEILSDAEKAKRERTRTATRGVVDIDVSDDGRVLVPLGQRVFIIEDASRAAGTKELQLGNGYPNDPRLSPDGRHVAFVQGGNVWIASTSGGAPVALTAAKGDVDFGSAEFVAQEELGRTRGYWWSPGSAQLLIQRSDSTRVGTWHVTDPRHPEKAPVPFRYPQPGEPNVDVSLALYPADGRGASVPVAWDTARFPYLVEAEWPKTGPLTLVVMNRAQTELALLAVDARTGAVRELLTERDDAWLNRVSPEFLPNGTFLWMSEQSGEWQLQHRDATGKLVRTLTPTGMGLLKLGGADATHAWVTASSDGTSDVVWRVPLAGGAPERMSDEIGVAAVKVKRDVAIIMQADRTGVVTVRVGNVIVPSVAEAPAAWPTTTLETVEANGQIYRAQITRPRVPRTGPAPVLLYVYGGPSVRVVTASPRNFLAQFYADAGFIVVSIDNRGTPGRGRAWERIISGDLTSAPVADQVAALRALATKHPEFDMNRVGVYGWSFGGTMSALLTMQHPDLFKAAVVGAPVTDWQLYDSTYTERYLRTPAENPEGYRRSNPITYASQLQRPMLLIHGITDDNVYFAHALALTEALYAAHKSIDFVPLSATHMVPDPKLELARERLQLEFFRRHLGQ